VTITDQIQKLWSDFLGFLSTLVIPDWPGLIALLPVFIAIGIIGPMVTLVVLAWLGYGVTKPRTPLKYQEALPYRAPLDHLGAPIFPAGEPYCPVDGLVHPFGSTRCEKDGTKLDVRCPKCALVREASVQTCGNCGLVLKIEPRGLVVASDRPPPGGAAVA
jgi:hypothetical protein